MTLYSGGNMSVGVRSTVFLMFLVSGFCGLLYQVIWIRLAYASFGIITPVMSVVISVFMLGLLLGSATGGPIAGKLVQRFRMTSILFYASAEFLIGVGAFCVPKLFILEEHLLLSLGSMNSFGYLFISAFAVAVVLLPWCILMGFTYPFMMTFVRETDRTAASSFSFLYLANVIGAMLGTIVTAVVLIELFGFAHTLVIAAVCNFSIAGVSVAISRRYPVSAGEVTTAGTEAEVHPMKGERGRFTIPFLLFINGFASMCMEIIWTRNFTPVLRTVVYSYASLLTTYLLASWMGSYLYRRHLARSKCFSIEALLGAIALFALLPLVVNDPRSLLKGVVPVLLSIMPLCGALGYLTPQLIDRYSKGSPSAAGWAYAVNTFGCILGPIFASYLFLPMWGVKISLLLLSGVLMACFAGYSCHSLVRQGWLMAVTALFIGLLSAGVFFNDTYEEYFHTHSPSLMRRDYAATVTSLGNTKGDKRLLVNGIGMTCLTPITQFMAHLPLAYCEQRPTSALVICFGMGTTFRSLVSWGINATAVELIPSVPRVFGYYWPDAEAVLANPLAEVVIDDGRRYLMRTDKKFDVVTIDPPPPVEAAGSSLLYSVEMYALIKQRLKDGGILQQWIPASETVTEQAVARALAASFPYVKSYRSIEDWGHHFVASMKPFRQLSAAELVSRMPVKARQDLMMWRTNGTVEEYMRLMLSKELPLDSVLSKDKSLIITDARPFNEYFLLRRICRRGHRLLAKNIERLFNVKEHLE
jgi:spermidine synthase